MADWLQAVYINEVFTQITFKSHKKVISLQPSSPFRLSRGKSREWATLCSGASFGVPLARDFSWISSKWKLASTLESTSGKILRKREIWKTNHHYLSDSFGRHVRLVIKYSSKMQLIWKNLCLSWKICTAWVNWIQERNAWVTYNYRKLMKTGNKKPKIKPDSSLAYSLLQSRIKDAVQWRHSY